MLTTILISFTFAIDLQSIVRTVNSDPTVTWKAQLNPRFAQLTREQLQALNRARVLPEDLKDYLFTPIPNDIPTEFDSASHWSHCPTIDTIFDQGHCGSCWAFSSFESFQDRFCIHSNGTMNPRISAQHMVSCTPNSNGCFGGWPQYAFAFAKGNGITIEECIPYQMGTCHHPDCPYYNTPKCNRTCYPNTSISVDKEKYYASAYGSIKKDEASIQTEIMKNGPVTAVFTVYDDFVTYRSGVYHHVTGKQLGLHAVKMTGWGVLNGVKYWKIANSWNTDFGTDGFFLIKRGSNECGIEGNIVSVMPKV